MDINDLTIKEAKEIAAQFGAMQSDRAGDLYADIIGKYVIVRSRNEGINCGYVKAAESTGIILNEARRLWYHKPMDKVMSWYEGVATCGVSEDSKLSCAVMSKTIVEDYSATVCTAQATKSLKEAPNHEQN